MAGFVVDLGLLDVLPQSHLRHEGAAAHRAAEGTVQQQGRHGHGAAGGARARIMLQQVSVALLRCCARAKAAVSLR